MKTFFNVVSTVSPKYHEAASDLGYYEIDEMIEALECRRYACEAARLRTKGFDVITELERTDGSGHDVLRYPLVVAPSKDRGVYATFEELRRLSDTAANLPVDEAFARWEGKISPTEWSFRNVTQLGMEIEMAVLSDLGR